MRKLAIALGLVVVVALSCFASDLTGLWKGTLKVPNRDDIELTYKLKTEGEILTGSVISPFGEIPIHDGVVKDDDFSFKMEFGEYVVEQKGRFYTDSIVVKSNFRGSDFQATFRKIK